MKISDHMLHDGVQLGLLIAGTSVLNVTGHAK